MKPDSRAESSEIGAHVHPRILGTAQLPQIEVPILVVETYSCKTSLIHYIRQHLRGSERRGVARSF